MPPPYIDGTDMLFRVVCQAVRPLTPITPDATSLYLVERYE